MRVSAFADIEKDFLARVRQIVWCNVATVDRRGRPRSRILHPIWERRTGWILTGRHTLKTRHLAANPHVSLCYASGDLQQVYVDCRAEWADDPADKTRLWDLFASIPPPIGYDPIAPSATRPSSDPGPAANSVNLMLDEPALTTAIVPFTRYPHRARAPARPCAARAPASTSRRTKRAWPSRRRPGWSARSARAHRARCPRPRLPPGIRAASPAYCRTPGRERPGCQPGRPPATRCA